MTTRTLTILLVAAAAFCGCDRERAVTTSTGLPKAPVRWPGLSSQSGSCELHGVAKIQDTVSILYGQMFIDRATTNFPNAWSFVGGGCRVTSDSPTQALIYFCPICRGAESKWKGQHDK
jgi:hypothetical protein